MCMCSMLDMQVEDCSLLIVAEEILSKLAVAEIEMSASFIPSQELIPVL